MQWVAVVVVMRSDVFLKSSNYVHILRIVIFMKRFPSLSVAASLSGESQGEMFEETPSTTTQINNNVFGQSSKSTSAVSQNIKLFHSKFSLTYLPLSNWTEFKYYFPCSLYRPYILHISSIRRVKWWYVVSELWKISLRLYVFLFFNPRMSE